MAQLSSDLACFMKLVQRKMSGMTESYVNDKLSTGDEEFEEESKMKERTF